MTKKIPPPLPSGNPESVKIRPFWKAYTDIFETSLSAYEKIILTAVASWPDGQCRYSEKTLARYASCSTKTIQRSIKSLADKGLLLVSPVGGTTSIYRTIPWTHSPTPLDTESIPPWTESPDTLDTESTYKNIYKINNKIIDKNTVADAPTPIDEFPLILEQPQDLEVVQESDSFEKPNKEKEPPQIPAAPPKKRKEPAGRKVTFPSVEYWTEKKPDLLTWMREHGAEGSDEALLPWIDERLEKLEGAALSKDMKYAAWDRTFMTWYRHLIPDKYKRGFDWFVRNAVDQARFIEVWKKKKELEAFGYSDEGIEGYRKTLLNFDEDSPWGGNKIKHFRKTVQKGA